MAWTGLNLTVEGRNALNRAQVSGELNFKSIVVGDGDTPVNYSTIQGLVHQLYEVENLMVEVKDDSCTLTADFPQVDYDYYFREIGVMVNTDEGPKLYVYDNCGSDAQYIVTTSGVESTRKRIRLLLKISDVAEITVEKPEVLYVSYTDMQENREEIEAWVTGELEKKADSSVVDTHFKDTVKHTSSAEKDKWYNNSSTYGTCETAAGTAAKTVACTGFKLAAGAEITVKFTVTNTASNPTLNVNGSGAKPIYYRGAAISAGYLATGRTYCFRYNGTQWDLVGDINTNTTYSAMTGATASAAGKSGLVPAPAAGTQGNVLKGDGTWDAIENLSVSFSQASSRANITSKEALKTSLGKIMKWFADLAAGAASTLLGSNLTASRALVSNASGKVSVSAVTSTELGYLDGVTSNVQTQLDALNTDMNWKLAGQSAGSYVGGSESPVSIPETAREILIIVIPLSNSNKNSDTRYTLCVPSIYLTYEYKLFCVGHDYPHNDTNAGSAGLWVSKSSARCDWASCGTADSSHQYFMDVYYR